jgi:hypothetical protein
MEDKLIKLIKLITLYGEAHMQVVYCGWGHQETKKKVCKQDRQWPPDNYCGSYYKIKFATVHYFMHV